MDTDRGKILFILSLAFIEVSVPWFCLTAELLWLERDLLRCLKRGFSDQLF